MAPTRRGETEESGLAVLRADQTALLNARAGEMARQAALVKDQANAMGARVDGLGASMVEIRDRQRLKRGENKGRT